MLEAIRTKRRPKVLELLGFVLVISGAFVMVLQEKLNKLIERVCKDKGKRDEIEEEMS
jgi:hypothetical protein